MPHARQPVPNTFFCPKYKMNSTPAMEMTRYTGGIAVFQIFALTADLSYADKFSSYAFCLSFSRPKTRYVIAFSTRSNVAVLSAPDCSL